MHIIHMIDIVSQFSVTANWN